MNLGTKDRKKVVFLAILGLLAAYLVYSNLFSGPPGAPPETARTATPQPAAAAPSPIAQTQITQTPVARAAGGRAGKGDEFHPVLHSKRPEDRIDPTTIDPTLKLELLAKVHAVEPAGAGRNLFLFGAPPPPKEALTGAGLVIKPKPPMGPPVAPPIAVVEPPKPPPPPPINLKYYGFSTTRDNGKKTAFFLDGDEIVIAREGETVKKRYRLVRIGVNSVLMEDTESKSQQSVPLQEEQAS